MNTHSATLTLDTSTRPAAPAARGVPTRLVTGLTPSGRLHVGNYVGAIRPLLALASQPGTSAIVFVADLHAMTTEHDPGRLRADTRELAATLLACGSATRPRCSCSRRCPRTPSWPTCSSAPRRTAR